MNYKKLTQDGLTLVELLVAIAVAVVVVASLNQVVTNYIHLAQKGRHLNAANAYAEAKAESIRNKGYNTLVDGTTSLTSELPTSMPRVRSGSMTISSPLTGIKKVVIDLTYTSNGKSQSLNYATYIGELGVGQ